MNHLFPLKISRGVKSSQFNHLGTTESKANKLDIRASQSKPLTTKKLPLRDMSEAEKEEIFENFETKYAAKKGKPNSISLGISGLSDFDCTKSMKSLTLKTCFLLLMKKSKSY